jgi:hypothetical protein
MMEPAQSPSPKRAGVSATSFSGTNILGAYTGLLNRTLCGTDMNCC